MYICMELYCISLHTDGRIAVESKRDLNVQQRTLDNRNVREPMFVTVQSASAHNANSAAGGGGTGGATGGAKK